MGGSGPDNAGAVQYYQMCRVRLARGKGTREKPVHKPLNFAPCSNLVDMGRYWSA